MMESQRLSPTELLHYTGVRLTVVYDEPAQAWGIAWSNCHRITHHRSTEAEVIAQLDHFEKCGH